VFGPSTNSCSEASVVGEKRGEEQSSVEKRTTLETEKGAEKPISQLEGGADDSSDFPPDGSR